MNTQSRDSSGMEINRRRFLKATGGMTVALTAASYARAAGANDRIGVGLIGAGGRSGAHHKAVLDLKKRGYNVEIVAVCDAYQPRAREKADGLSAKIYKNHNELLADPAVDVVCIATPDHHHAQQAIDAAYAGKDIYCEKPISHWTQFELTKKLARVVKEKKVVFQVGSQGLSDPVFEQAAALVREGAIGNPIHAQCGYFRVGDWGERGMPIPDPKAQPGPDLDWGLFLGTAPKRDFDVSRFFRWRMYKDYAGGPSTDLYPHVMAPVVKVLGVKFPSRVVAVGGMYRYAEREVPDTFDLLIEYPEKVTLAVLGTQGNNHGVPSVVRGWDATINFAGPGLVIEPTEGSEKKPIEVARSSNESQAGWDQMEIYWHNFLECCRSRQKPLGDIDLAYHVQTALQMSMLAFMENKVVRFDAEKEEIVV